MRPPYQLPEPFAVETPLGPGYAIVLEAGGHDYFWTVVLETGALVTFTQDRIRAADSYTHGRGVSDERMRQTVRLKRRKTA